MYPVTLWTRPEMRMYYYAALFAITVPLQPSVGSLLSPFPQETDQKLFLTRTCY